HCRPGGDDPNFPVTGGDEPARTPGVQLQMGCRILKADSGKTLRTTLAGMAACAAMLAAGVSWPAAAAAPTPTSAAPHANLLETSCSACHNSTDWAGGLAFDTLSFDSLQADAEVWEETIRKLRGRLMPPPGEPQPTQPEIDAFVGWLTARLDSAATAAPDPGYVGLHRLNRNEYGREISRI